VVGDDEIDGDNDIGSLPEPEQQAGPARSKTGPRPAPRVPRPVPFEIVRRKSSTGDWWGVCIYDRDYLISQSYPEFLEWLADFRPTEETAGSLHFLGSWR
jgi:hypothetical protein